MKLREILTIGVFFTVNITLTGCGGSYESQDRKMLDSSFVDNFGFKPPVSVKEIKLKNWGLYDAYAHCMGFTYDSIVMARILDQDNSLKTAFSSSPELLEIIEGLQKNVNIPKWLEIPGIETDRVYYKKDFLDHTFSEYYLWANKEKRMTFLFVHYFD